MGINPEDEIGRELRRNRPAPTDEYVASIAGSVRRSGRSSISTRRLAVAALLSVVALGALAATGGLTQARAAPQSVVKIVKKAVADKPASRTRLHRVNNSAAIDQYGERCNSGRGNGSEGSDAQLVNPHNGETGPGQTPTLDCDPGNSGSVNHGGD